MTKTWIAVLAVALGLPGAILRAAEQPDDLSLPPTELKAAPTPLDNKPSVPAPAAANWSYGPAVPGPVPNTWATPAPVTWTALAPAAPPAPAAPVAPAANPSGPPNPTTAPCANSGLLGCCSLRAHLCFSENDHPCLKRLWNWLYYPCHLTPCGCCEWPARPMPDGYEYFLWLHCVEGSCGSCCRGGGNGCNGSNSCGK